MECSVLVQFCNTSKMDFSLTSVWKTGKSNNFLSNRFYVKSNVGIRIARLSNLILSNLQLLSKYKISPKSISEHFTFQKKKSLAENESKIPVFLHCDIVGNISCNHLRTLVFDPLLVKIELELNCISSKNEKKRQTRT